MDALVFCPPFPNIHKRSVPDHESPEAKPLNLRGDQFTMPTPPNTSLDGTMDNDQRERVESPNLSSAPEITPSTGLRDSSTTIIAPGATTSPSEPPPAKRRKLASTEMLEQAKLREAREREKAEKKAEKEREKAEREEEKARRAEEKRVKDEEKRQAAEEKEARKRQKELDKERKEQEKEAQKRERELEQERKEQAKLERDRKQLRLSAFYTPTTLAKATPESAEKQSRNRVKSISLEPFDTVADRIREASPAKGVPRPTLIHKPMVSDYRKTFLPFQLHAYTTLAPQLGHSPADQDKFDHELNDPSIQEKYDLGLVDSYINLKTSFSNLKRGCGYPDIKSVVHAMESNSKLDIIDLNGDHAEDNPLEILKKVPKRYIQFSEDFRPAYCGTYTKIRSPRAASKTARNPFTRSRPDTNYDYDSEAEWAEPEEGDEDVLSDEEDDAESNVDANEMDDFLDDTEDKAKTKGTTITGELVPESTGLCWEDESRRICASNDAKLGDPLPQMKGMRTGFLLPGFSGMTIDPFSDKYWQACAPIPAAPTQNGPLGMPTGPLGTQPASCTSMAPPRPPLQPRLNCGGAPPQDSIEISNGKKGMTASQGGQRRRKRAPRVLSKEDLEEFKEAVVGSPLSKFDLLKGLKSR